MPFEIDSRFHSLCPTGFIEELLLCFWYALTKVSCYLGLSDLKPGSRLCAKRFATCPGFQSHHTSFEQPDVSDTSY